MANHVELETIEKEVFQKLSIGLVSFAAGIRPGTFGIYPDEGRDFCIFQTVHTSSGVRPASLMYRGSYPGVQQPGREVDHSRSSSAEIKNKWSYTSTPFIGLSSRRWTRTLLFFTVYLPNTSETLPPGPVGTVGMFIISFPFIDVYIKCYNHNYIIYRSTLQIF
jgi:hypothetical protein